MKPIYLTQQDARNAAADLFTQQHLARLNNEVAPPSDPVQTAGSASGEAAGGQSVDTSSVNTGPTLQQQGVAPPAAAAPSAPTAPVTAPLQAPAQQQPDRTQVADQFTRNAVADAWQNDALSSVAKGISQVGQGVQSALSGVPTGAQSAVPQSLATFAGSQTPTSAGPQSAPSAPLPSPAAPAPNVAQPQGDFQSYARQAAQKYGVDPDVFVRQIQQESGFNPGARSGAGAIGIAQFMPGTAQGMGVDPTDPYASLDAAARMDSQNLQRYGGDYGKALAAYNAGPGNVDKYGGVPPFEETQRYVATILGGTTPQSAPGQTQQAASTGQSVALNRTSQFQLGLSPADALAACGPAAAIAFAKAFGRTPTVDEAMQLAQQSGWTQGGGMNGVVNEKKLLDAMGVPTKLETTVDWSKITSDVTGGNPVIVSTPGHYFTVDDAKPAQGGDQMLYHVGTSGTDLKAGAEWMTQSQIEHLEGQANGVLYADNPGSPTPSIAAQAGNVVSTVSQAVQTKAQDLISAVQNLGKTSTPGPPIQGAYTSLLPGGTQDPNQALLQTTQTYGPNAMLTAGEHALGQNVISPALQYVATGEGPIGEAKQQAATGLQQMGQDVSQTGVPLLSGAAGAALNVAGGFVGAPSVLQSAKTLSDIPQKYGTFDSSQWSPEDKQAYTNAAIAVGGLVSSGGAFDKYGVEAGFTPPVAKGAPASEVAPVAPAEVPLPNAPMSGPEGARPLFGRGGAPGGPVGGLQPVPAAPEAGGSADLLQAMLDQVRARGVVGPELDDAQSYINRIRQQENQAGPAQGAPPQTPTAPPPGPPSVPPAGPPPTAGGPGGGGVVPPAGGPGGGPPQPPPTGPGGAGAPTVPPVAAPGSFWQVLNAYHSGNVVMGPATAVKVAANTMFAPVWNFTTQSARDLTTLNFDRVGGRVIGTGQALVNIGNDFINGFSGAMANRVTSGNSLVDAFLTAQHAAGGALHAGLQNVTAEMVRRMELGAGAGEYVAAQRQAGVQGVQSIANLISNPAQLPADAVARANDVAMRAGLRAPAGATQQVVQNMLNQAANTPVGAVTNFLLPVFRIGAQAAARGIESSPLGLAGTGFDVARGLAGRGPYAAGFNQYGQAVTPLADRLTNNLAGTAVTAWLASKALDGTVTGTGPDDPRARADLQAQGWRPESVLVPGTGYVSYTRLPEQLRVPLELAAAYGEAVNGHKGDAMGTAAALAQNVGRTLVQGLPGLQTLGDVGGILKGDPNAVGFLVGGGLAGYIPGSAVLSNVANATDQFARQIPNRAGYGAAILGNITQGLPGLREQMQPKVNVLGQPMPNPAAGLAEFLPVRTPGEVAPGTPGLKALTFLNQSGLELAGAPSTISYQGRQLALSPDEQSMRQQVLGQRLDQTLAGFMNSQKFQTESPDQKRKALDPILRAAAIYADQRVVAAMDPADRKTRLAMAPRSGQPAPIYPSGGGIGSLLLQQSQAGTDAAHQRLLQSYAAQATPAALTGPTAAGASR